MPIQSTLFDLLPSQIRNAINRKPTPKTTAALPTTASNAGLGDLFNFTSQTQRPSQEFLTSSPHAKPKSNQKPVQLGFDFNSPSKSLETKNEQLRTHSTDSHSRLPSVSIQQNQQQASTFQETRTRGRESNRGNDKSGNRPPASVQQLHRKSAAKDDSAGNGAGNSAERTGVSAPRNLRPAGLTAALENTRAIELTQNAISENRPVTDDERAIINKYRGWGGLPNIFDETKLEWAEPREKLKSILGENEYRSARASTLNAHYTSPEIAAEMWDFLKNINLKFGNILEPGCGKGTFISCKPDNISARITGIEIDKTSAQIASLLNPDHEVRNEGFENTQYAPGSFDCTIGNVPFGNFSLRDIIHNKNNYSIHNHFINKGLQFTKPGGYAVLLTSRYTLDAKNSDARAEISQHSDLVAALRLPEGAFRASAATDVVTDILILRRRQPGEEPRTDWLQSTPLDVDGASTPVNEYFHRNPNHVLGTLATGRGMYRDAELTVRPTGDISELPAQLRSALSGIADQVNRSGLGYGAKNIEAPTGVLVPPPAPLSSQEGSFIVDANGRLGRQTNGRLSTDHGVPDAHVDRVMRLVGMRDTARSLLDIQGRPWDGTGAAPWSDAQAKLNTQYDEFIAKYGYINKCIIKTKPGATEDDDDKIKRIYPNHRHLSSDPDAQFVFALENLNEQKCDIFHSRVLSPVREVKHANNVNDAMMVCLDENGGAIDISRIAQLVKKSEAEVERELLTTKLAFRNPASGNIEIADEYLSGNVREKLRIAEKSASENHEYKINVEALQAVQPKDLVPGQFTVRLGAPYIPEEYIRQFTCELLDTYSVDSFHIKSLSQWNVSFGKYSKSSASSVQNISEWGTARYTGLELINDALNMRQPTVWDVDSEGKRTKNPKETLLAQEKLERIHQRFSKWIFEDDDRAMKICDIYNKKFNCTTLRTYDGSGSHLTFPGMSRLIKLRPHQKDAVFRVLASGNTLLHHVVGSGKSFTSIAAAMELRRTRGTNSWFVVPNHMLRAFSQDIVTLYPAARVLSAEHDEISTPDQRKRFVARAALGTYDAVVITHSAFGKIGMSDEFQQKFIQKQVDELREELEKIKEEKKDRITVKKVEAAIMRKTERLQKLMNSEAKDNFSISFEATHADQIFVDEAHAFKNLEYSSRISGLSSSASQRATDLFQKITYLNEKNPGRCVSFLTGTPISNSLVEAYTMQRYLRPDVLERNDMTHFDSWAAMFTTPITAMELSADSSSYKTTTRLKFNNFQQLLTMYHDFADVQTAAKLKLPTPMLENGKPIVIVAKPTDTLKEFVKHLGERAEAVRSRRTDSDNMLWISTDGRKSSLDLRLCGITPPDEEGSCKINMCADNVSRLFHETKNQIYSNSPTPGALQLIFCDTSAPSEKWNAYDELKRQLINRGVPSNKIAYIHDAPTDDDKANLFEKCRNGDISILIGSTQKLGCGTNIQTRLHSLHNLDAPWRPCDLTQRAGRILRQGNENASVRIYNYVQQESFDTFVWQTLERKEQSFAAFKNRDSSITECDDVDMPQCLTYGEIKGIASGNPLLLEKATVDAEVYKLQRLKSGHDETLWRLRGIRRQSTSELDRLSREQSAIRDSIRRRTDTSGDQFTAAVGRASITDRKRAGELLSAKISNCLSEQGANPRARSVHFATIGGLPIAIATGGAVGTNRAEIIIDAPHPLSVTVVSVGAVDGFGIVRAIEHRLRSYDDHQRRTAEAIKHHQSQISQSEIQLSAQFEHQHRLDAALARQAEIEIALNPPPQAPELPSVPSSAPAPQIDPAILTRQEQSFILVLQKHNIIRQFPTDKQNKIIDGARQHSERLLKIDKQHYQAHKVNGYLDDITASRAIIHTDTEPSHCAKMRM